MMTLEKMVSIFFNLSLLSLEKCTHFLSYLTYVVFLSEESKFPIN